MKRLLILLAATVCLSVTAYAQAPDSLSPAAQNRLFATEFVRQAQRLRCNIAGCNDTTRAVYDLYRDLFDEAVLLDRGIIRAPRPGRYVTPQTTIDYGVLPPDSTLNTVRVLLDASPDSLAAQTPRGALLRGVLDTLVPFRVEMQRAFRRTVGYRIVTFYPQTVYPADSVLYITRDMLKNMEEFSKKGLAIGREVGRERNELLLAEFSARTSAWTPYVNWIDRPLMISAVIMEDNLGRAFVNALVGGTQGWGLLLERGADGRWGIVAARVLYQAAES